MILADEPKQRAIVDQVLMSEILSSTSYLGNDMSWRYGTILRSLSFTIRNLVSEK